MKQKMWPLLSILLLCCSLLFALFGTCVAAEDKDYKISLTNKAYTVGRIIEDRPPTVVYLNISITLYNTGPDVSDDITVSIWDSVDLTPVKRNATIPAGGSHVFLFSGDTFFVVNKGEHTINISYYPTDLTVLKSSDNTGVDTMIVQAGSSGTGVSTPGFELIILIAAIIVIILIPKRKKT